MSKAKRNRQRRHGQAHNTPRAFTGCSWKTPPADAVQGGTAEAMELAANFADATEMPCRATFLDDPVFGDALQALTLGIDGTLIPGSADRTEAPPVLLFELTQLMGMQDIHTGTVHEMRTEAMITGGFQRLTGPVWSITLADGWSVGRTVDMVKLRDPEGGVVAESDLILDPVWVSAAVSHGYVLVLHGFPLGVRVPPGKTEHTYMVADRAMEFRQARNNGLLTGAMVKWAGTIKETLNWVLFHPGAFGLSVPMAYVPLWNFTSHGGPEEFGFRPLNKRIQAPFATGLVAHLTETDLDLVRPDETDPSLAFITGYHDHGEPSSKGFFQTWRQAVLACSGLVVMTGDQAMPSMLGVSAEQDQLACEVMSRSWGAKVLLNEDCKIDLLASQPVPSQQNQPRDRVSRAEQQAEYMHTLKDKLLGLESFNVYTSNALEALIDKAELQRWLTNLWPITCQTCREPLGTKADISADGPMENGKILISMHHSSCRPSGITPLEGITMSCPTHSIVAGYLSGAGSKAGNDDIPVMVVNPSCEQLQLVPDASGGWANATLEAFTTLGFTRPNGNFPPTTADAEAEICGEYLLVTLTGYVPDAPDQEWAIKPPKHVLDQVRRLKGLAVSLVTKALPTLLLPEDLASAFTDDEARIAWVQLMQTD